MTRRFWLAIAIALTLTTMAIACGGGSKKPQTQEPIAHDDEPTPTDPTDPTDPPPTDPGPTPYGSPPECTDGTSASCDLVPATCPSGQIHATVGSCFGPCVDPTTCLATPNS